MPPGAGAAERTLGKEHAETLSSVHKLAGVLYKKRDYAGAERLYRRALEAQGRTLGKEHPDTRRTMNSGQTCLTRKVTMPGRRLCSARPW